MGQPPPEGGVGPAGCFCDCAFSSINLLLLFEFFSFIAAMTGSLKDTAVVGGLLSWSASKLTLIAFTIWFLHDGEANRTRNWAWFPANDSEELRS